MKRYLIKLKEKLHPMREMGYAVSGRDQRRFLILVNTRETPHAKGLPHAHLQQPNTDNICCFFITKETPRTKSDLRFVKKTFKSQIPSQYKDALVEWANEPYGEGGNNWEYLKEYHGRLWSSGTSPTPYPEIKRLEIVE
jgi:hypothetical protein